MKFNRMYDYYSNFALVIISIDMCSKRSFLYVTCWHGFSSFNVFKKQ